MNGTITRPLAPLVLNLISGKICAKGNFDFWVWSAEISSHKLVKFDECPILCTRAGYEEAYELCRTCLSKAHGEYS